MPYSINFNYNKETGNVEYSLGSPKERVPRDKLAELIGVLIASKFPESASGCIAVLSRKEYSEIPKAKQAVEEGPKLREWKPRENIENLKAGDAARFRSGSEPEFVGVYGGFESGVHLVYVKKANGSIATLKLKVKGFVAKSALNAVVDDVGITSKDNGSTYSRLNKYLMEHTPHG